MDYGMTDAIEGTVVDDAPADDMMSREVATRESSASRLAVAPQADASELVARLGVIKEAMDTAMVEGIDYGRIPGVQKPSLLKPGSEKLGVLFQLDVQIENTKTWGPGDHLTVESKATVYHAPTGARLASGEGACSTREKKYAKRQQERTCPECGAPAILKSKKRDDGSGGNGWFCWRKKGGCGATFADDNDPRIASQEVGETENPDLPDTWNTVIKMAAKRARVDAILAATGASALFTQDAEDHAPTAPAVADVGPPHGPAADAALSAAASTAVLTFAGGDMDAAKERWRSIKVVCGGYLPHAAAAALCAAAGTPQAPTDAGTSA